MRLYDSEPDYIRLDDDVSFQILRTNPKLTTNTKLMYDGENLFMEAYDAAPILSTLEYKHHRVWKTGLFNRDIRNFLLGSNTAAYEVGQAVKDTIVLDNFDNQFENMYWCGVESINSDAYPQEMGCIAPLYIRKKRPNYFVIFKITNPSNYNMAGGDNMFKFQSDIMSKAKIVKAFDLREGTVIGDYIKRYVEQRDFKYDQSVYVNFSSHEIYYYGIDKKNGVLTQKVENIEDQLLNNDNTIIKSDDWITSGFERNNLIFPYIINLEFLFDDNDINEFTFARYFGMYVNDIDLYDINVADCIYNPESHYTTVTTPYGSQDNLRTSNDCFYYIKDKYGNIYSASSTAIAGFFRCPGKLNLDNFTGFETTSTSTYAERLPGVGCALAVLEVVDDLAEGDTVKVMGTIDNLSGTSSDQIGEFIASDNYDAGQFYQNRFSCKGTLTDQAAALAGVIRFCNTDSLQWVTAYNIGNKVVIKAIYPGAHLNKIFGITFDNYLNTGKKINKVTEYFDGGTSINGCMFKVYTSDATMFFDESGSDRDPVRYLKCGHGRKNAAIQTIIPYINEKNQIDDTYSIIITDENGPYVNVSKTDQVEIIDKFYPRLGVLSMFPVRDFDFDTVSSAYGDYTMMQKELEDMNDRYLNYQYTNTDDDEVNPLVPDREVLENMPYARFYYNNGTKIDNEYSYYVENVIPELVTVNKTVPYIAKWGYMDESKDSCENPYRLNTSKIFEACNFSANTFMQKGDIMEYTHSMPYYVVDKNESDDLKKNEYQYITKFGGTPDDIIAYFNKKKNQVDYDPFFKVFGDTSNSAYSSKRYNKKYSRFLLGSDIQKSSTLFRGVKFEITELVNGNEVTTGKYNGYRFSCIYMPTTENSYKNTIHFVKNDDFKFIVCIVFFDMSAASDSFDFNKAYAYAGSMGFLERYIGGGTDNN